MPNFHLRSRGEPRYVVRLADCSPEHAKTVLEDVTKADGCPNDLELFEVENLYDEPPVRPGLFARLLRRHDG